MTILKKPENPDDAVRLEDLNERTDGKWVDLTLNTGWAHHNEDFNTIQYKKEGSKVYLRGIVKRVSGNESIITILPEEARPKKDNGLVNFEVGNKVHLVYILTKGWIQATSNYTTGQWISLDGLMYFLD